MGSAEWIDVDVDDLDLDEFLGIDATPDEEEPTPGAALDKRRRTVVCKHWLRGLCKRGDDCDFLHVYDPSRMPECLFFVHYAECTNKDCIFLHTRADEKKNECPWYQRGFCKHGALCKSRHTRKKACVAYLQGFCPKGPDCELVHPKMVSISTLPGKLGGAPLYTPNVSSGGANPAQPVMCFKCRKQGHYASNCPWANI